jgi:redox-sensitive bicupin YhaK (pirin superfamily)
MEPTIDIRRHDERFHTRVDWLDSWHSFSFGEHYDPDNTHHGLLLVSNDDLIAPGRGFGTHGHRDMEIISYVIDGALEHKDSLGTGSVLRRGDVQRMSAGTGVRHSEFNGSATEAVHFLQIWVLPQQQGLPASYEEKHFSDDDKRGRFRAIVRPGGADGALTVHQDVSMYAGVFAKDDKASFELAKGRHAWVQVARGAVSVNGTVLKPGDGAQVSDETRLDFVASEPAEVLVFDLA